MFFLQRKLFKKCFASREIFAPKIQAARDTSFRGDRAFIIGRVSTSFPGSFLYFEKVEKGPWERGGSGISTDVIKGTIFGVTQLVASSDWTITIGVT